MFQSLRERTSLVQRHCDFGHLSCKDVRVFTILVSPFSPLVTSQDFRRDCFLDGRLELLAMCVGRIVPALVCTLDKANSIGVRCEDEDVEDGYRVDRQIDCCRRHDWVGKDRPDVYRGCP